MPQNTPLVIASSLAVLLLFASSTLHADFVFVDANTPPCPIVIAADAEPQTIHLAGKLSDYLQAITEVKFPVSRELAERRIELIVDPRLDMPAEGYSWKVADSQIRITARTPRGLAYGVYGFLEEECGCRWWSFNEEDVPRVPNLKVKNSEVIRSPSFLMHDLYNREAQTPESDFNFKSGADSQLQFTGGHTLYSLLHAYGKDHPEIYPAAADGKRAPNDLHLCYLAPGIADALTAALELEVQMRKGNITDYIYFAGMGDWYDGQCQCEKCRAVYAEEKWTNPDGVELPGYTGTLLRMINASAEQLEKKYPGIQVGTFAYMSLEAPPAFTKPRKNVVIRVPRLRHCTVHAANECQGNRAFYQNLKRWQELAPGRVHVWDYGANFTNFLLPFPTLNSMADNITFYHELGIAGVMIQGNYVSTGSDAAVMKNYVWRKIIRDPKRSKQEVVEEFCQGYYGPAAKDVIGYVQTLENAVRLPNLKHADEFASPANVYLDEALLVKLREHLQHALQASAGTVNKNFHRRVLELQVSIEAAALWRSGPLVEKAGQLVRTDLAGDSYSRALALVEHSRRASPKEQGEGRLFREQFLQLHGGPIAKLASGDVSLRIAPVQGGKIGPISWRDQVVIESTTMQPACGANLYEFVGKPATNELTMRGDCGIAHWQPTAQHLAFLQVRQADSGQLTMTGSLQRVNQGTAKASVSITTTYPLSEKGKVTVEWQNAEGDWAALELTKAAPTGNYQGLVAMRIKETKVFDEVTTKLVVLDSYAAPATDKPIGFNAEFTFDSEKGTLQTSLQVDIADIPSDMPKPYVTRTLTITHEK